MPETGIKVWYRVRELAAAQRFYADLLGFEEIYRDADGRWARLRNGSMEIGLSEDEREDGGVAVVDVADAKAEAKRLREAGVQVGTVLELQGSIRLVDVFDPDGNRVQLAQLLAVS
jgi:catechol 2,3-dioxygenase-like lactoylglutathione lyase family enzyme